MLHKITLFPGTSEPLGFSIQKGISNFALFSKHATQVILALFNGEEKREIPLERTGDIWHRAIEHLPEGTKYAFRVLGPFDPSKGFLYKEDRYLSDPYSKMPATNSSWGQGTGSTLSFCKEPLFFDWQAVGAPLIPKEELIIYEMHVRGFTQHESSSISHPGTFLGIIEKIPHFKKLGVNAIELLPIFEFNERYRPDHLNYWGYNSLYFFAPMRRFAVNDPIIEFKTMVRELHKNGIEVLLDVVYNHTGEGNDPNHSTNFRGIDNTVYYMVDSSGHYRDFSGCLNTFNVNHEMVSKLILDSLRYWVEEMKVDGFRFDLASIFNRGCDGKPLTHSPILHAISSEPLFKKTKLIAEPWDAAGLYQPGEFAKLKNWSEWNGPFRDQVRRFIKGTDGSVGHFAKVLCGSHFLYPSTNPLSSINFVTVHDGFTLRDLVSYQKKRNLANGEMNQDGSDHNENWNCGAEGESNDSAILALRERQMRNFFLSLFLAQGIPMLKMGDEYGHTSQGNNNPYVQDNEISWFLWDELDKHQSIFDFVSSLISFRKNHPCFRMSHFVTHEEIEWHGLQPHHPNWGEHSRFIAFSMKGDSPFYVAFNADHLPKTAVLPKEFTWKEIVNTKNSWDQHNFQSPDDGTVVSSIELIPYSAFIAKGASLKEIRLI